MKALQTVGNITTAPMTNDNGDDESVASIENPSVIASGGGEDQAVVGSSGDDQTVASSSGKDQTVASGGGDEEQTVEEAIQSVVAVDDACT